MPVVQRSRPGTQSDQHWSMLLFESLSAGVIAVSAGLAAVMVVVGLYVIIIWPLTFWDLANLGLDQYSSWTNTILWSIFAGGTLAGFWCFSGRAFRPKPKNSAAVPARAVRSRR
jgi:hypothetical protein